MASSEQAALQELASMVVRIIGDSSSYKRMMKDVVSNTQEMSKTIKTGQKDAEVFGKTIDNLGTHMSAMAGQFRAMASLGSPFEMLKKGVSLAADSEAMEVSFGTMLRSVEAGKEMVKDLQQFAAATPLNTSGIQAATKTLLQFGVEGRQIVPTLKMLGDAASGEQDKLMRLAVAYGQAKSAGRLMGEELAQMREAGFNPLQEIARTTGKSVSELTSDMERGKISVQMMTNAFKTATGAGGMFENGMEQQSKTLKGLFSTMQDDIDATLRTIGQSVVEKFGLKEAVNNVSKSAKYITESFESIGPGVKSLIVGTTVLVGSFGSLVVVWKVTAIAGGMVVGVLKDVVISMKAVATSSTAATAGMVALKAAMGVGVAVAAYGVTTSLTGARDSINKMNEEAEKSVTILAKLKEIASKRGESALKEMGALHTPEEQGKFLADNIKMTEKEIEGITKNIASMQKKLDDVDITWSKAWSSFKGDMRSFTFEEMAGNIFGNKDWDHTKDQITTLRGVLEATRTSLDAFKTAKEDLERPKATKEVAELTNKLQLQASTFGMTADEIEVYKVKMAGATEAQLANIRGLVAMNAELKEMRELAEAAKNAVPGLGAAMVKGIGFGAKVAADAVKRLTDEGKEITKQFRTPTEKFTDRVIELQNLLNNGFIDETTFGRAFEDAKLNMMGTVEEAKNLRHELRQIDAVQVGSAEAFSRMATQREMFNRPTPTLSNDMARFNQAAQAAQAAKAQQSREKMVNLLQKIEGKDPLDIEPANFGEG